jgi:formylglycine-generating enzyme required for sulfatase activity
MDDFSIGKDGKRMLHVPAGYFTMGSGLCEDEIPVHRVYLDAFFIDETPVTNAEYKRFLDAKPDYPAPPGWDKKRRTFPPRKADHPVVNVSWEDANAYARWAGKQLPTEAQWEKAARGIDRRRYPWGDEFDPTRCNSWETAIFDTTPVARYAPRGNSPYGVMDMAGNVWEWCADWYAADYYQHSPSHNPAGPTDGILRVLRGGAWSSDRSDLRAANRGLYYPRYSNVLVGFRCVKND